MDKFVFGLLPEGGSDKQRIMKVVSQLKEFLAQVVDGEECDSYFFPELLRPMKEAWPEVSNRFTDLKDRVTASQFASLEEHGLTGQELKYKLSVINHSADQFFHYFFKGPAFWARYWLKKLLEALDKFLTSLVDAVGGGGAIGEYKNFVESSIDDLPPLFLRRMLEE